MSPFFLGGHMLRIKCNYCGNEMWDDVKVCVQCGSVQRGKMFFLKL